MGTAKGLIKITPTVAYSAGLGHDGAQMRTRGLVCGAGVIVGADVGRLPDGIAAHDLRQGIPHNAVVVEGW